jgi:hypothetical protein
MALAPYDVDAVLGRIDAHPWLLAALMVPPWLGGFVQIVTALRNGARDRAPGQPLAMTTVLLAHDLTYALAFAHYFEDVDHIFFKLCWVGMLPSVVIEVVLLVQWCRCTREDLGRDVGDAEWGALIAVAVLASLGLVAGLRAVIEDPLNLVGFVVVQVAAVAFLPQMALMRGSTRGQSRAFACATVLGPGSLGFGFVLFLAPEMRSAGVLAAIAATALLALTYLAIYERQRWRERVAGAAPTT